MGIQRDSLWVNRLTLKPPGNTSMTTQSYHTDIEGHDVHYLEGGGGFPILLLHGVGPGTSIMGNFEPVIKPLTERYHVYASDLIGFGNSSWKKEPPYFDVDMWIRQGLALIELMPEGPCGIAGHSMGGALSLKIAAASDRITHILTSSTVGTLYKITPALDAFWSLPQDQNELRRSMGDMVAHPSAVTNEMIQGRWDLLEKKGYSDYFRKMFEPPRQLYLDAGNVSDTEIDILNSRGVKITMIHGDRDKPCPFEYTTAKLSERLPDARVVLLENCGHNLPREASESYLSAANALFG